MIIVFFTAHHKDGSGDVAHTLKVADFLQRKLSKDYPINTIVVVPEGTTTLHNSPKLINHYDFTARLAKEINPEILIQTISVFMSSNVSVNCYFEASELIEDNFNSEQKDRIKEARTGNIPYIFLPEYSAQFTPDDDDNTILSGFRDNELGVIPSITLLEATSTPISAEILKKAFDTLDLRLQKYLLENKEEKDEKSENQATDSNLYLDYRKTHGLSYQYSHDTEYYQTYSRQGIAKTKESAVFLFLSQHASMVGDSTKSQDVICIGKNKEEKYKSLMNIKSILEANNYTDLLFVDIDNNKEEHYKLQKDSNLTTKQYRVLYLSSLPFSSMQALPLLSDDLIGATGDNTIVEGMSAGKLVSYETIGHKKAFAQGYLSSVKRELMMQKGSADVLLLACQLVKSSSYKGVSHDLELFKELMAKADVVNKLKEINRNLILNSTYLQEIENTVISIFKNNLANEPAVNEEQHSKEVQPEFQEASKTPYVEASHQQLVEPNSLSAKEEASSSSNRNSFHVPQSELPEPQEANSPYDDQLKFPIK